MTGAIDDKTFAHAVRNICAQAMRGARLTGCGNIVLRALDRHKGRVPDRAKIDRLVPEFHSAGPYLAVKPRA